MKLCYKTRSFGIMLVVMVFCSLLFYPPTVLSAAANISDTLSAERMVLMKGEPIVILSSLDDGVTGVTGKIYIAAPPKKVWEVLTDYNHHKNFIPNIIDSGLIADNGVEQVMFQTGKSKIFIFQMKVYAKLKITGEYLKHLDFQQISGDFKVYKGGWILENYHEGKGTFLFYKAEVKPDFFAPSFIVRHVQRHDFPAVLSAMKAKAESTSLPVLK
ncbi:MAG: SRPBCC family protein [Chlorobiales bacterium]|nr:SRPBCC family protein [Chlorobiales bacterium]